MILVAYHGLMVIMWVALAVLLCTHGLWVGGVAIGLATIARIAYAVHDIEEDRKHDTR